LHVHNVVGPVIGQVAFGAVLRAVTEEQPQRGKNDRHGDQRGFDFARSAISIKLVAPGNGSMIPGNARRK